MKAIPSILRLLRKSVVFASGLLLVAASDPRPGTFLAGCLLVAFAWALRIWSFGHLDKNLHMTTTGPYAHTRNPAYLGSFLALLGVGLAAGNPDTLRGQLVWGFLALLAAVFLFEYLPRKFRREYPRLQAIFGEDLERHAANVPNFLPRLGSWRSGDARKFSWARVTANHEWPWGLVLALVLAGIATSPQWSPFTGASG
jgi:protein-S-isoprenylcysteine O-methyltransferase Ste14